MGGTAPERAAAGGGRRLRPAPANPPGRGPLRPGRGRVRLRGSPGRPGRGRGWGRRRAASGRGPRPGPLLGELGLLSGQGRSWPRWCWSAERCWWSRPSASASCSRAIPASGTWCYGPISCARSLAVEDGARMGIVGSRSVTDTRRLRGCAWSTRQRWIDADDRRAQAPLRELGVAPQRALVVLWRGQPGPANPSNTELARMIALLVPSSGETVCDLVLVGMGTGELAAVVDAAADGLAAVALAAIARAAAGLLVLDRGLPRVPGRDLRSGAGRAGGRAGRHRQPMRCSWPGDRDRRCRHPRRRQCDRHRPVAGGAGAVRLTGPHLGEFEGRASTAAAADGRPGSGPASRSAAAAGTVRPHERERRRDLPAAWRRAALKRCGGSGHRRELRKWYASDQRPQLSSLQPHRQPLQRVQSAAY